MTDAAPAHHRPEGALSGHGRGREELLVVHLRQLQQAPFCDGTHKGSAFSPLKYTAEKDGQTWFCGCKATAKSPLCDGRHKAL